MAIAFRAAGAVNSTVGPIAFTVAAPAGIAATDVCLVVLSYGAGTGVSFTPPAGWTLAKRVDNGTTAGIAIYWGLGTATFGDWKPVNAVDTIIGFSLAYTGVDNTTPMDAAAVGQANASSTTVTAPSITTATANAWLVAVFDWYDPAGGPLPTWSAVFGTSRVIGSFDASTFSASLDANATDAAQAGAGASGTKTATVSVAAANIGMLVALRPAGGGGGATIRPSKPVVKLQAVERSGRNLRPKLKTIAKVFRPKGYKTRKPPVRKPKTVLQAVARRGRETTNRLKTLAVVFKPKGYKTRKPPVRRPIVKLVRTPKPIKPITRVRKPVRQVVVVILRRPRKITVVLAKSRRPSAQVKFVKPTGKAIRRPRKIVTILAKPSRRASTVAQVRRPIRVTVIIAQRPPRRVQTVLARTQRRFALKSGVQRPKGGVIVIVSQQQTLSMLGAGT